MAAQHLVRHGMRWRVGNGEKILVWVDKWLPTPTFKVISPQNTLHVQAPVSELIDSHSGDWNSRLVQQVFLPHEAEIILGLPLSNSLPDDKLIWNPSSNGIFSVRNAYKLTMEVRDQPRDGSCSNDSDIKCFGEEFGDYISQIKSNILLGQPAKIFSQLCQTLRGEGSQKMTLVKLVVLTQNLQVMCSGLVLLLLLFGIMWLSLVIVVGCIFWSSWI